MTTHAEGRLLDRVLTDEMRRAWTAQVAEPAADRRQTTVSVMVFRLGKTWSALSTESVERIAPLSMRHTLPSHRNPGSLHLVNIDGDLLVCVDLGKLLNPVAHQATADTGTSRLVVLNNRLVFVADEVLGIVRLDPSAMSALPATLLAISRHFSRGLITSDDRCISWLDDEHVLNALAMTLA